MNRHTSRWIMTVTVIAIVAAAGVAGAQDWAGSGRVKGKVVDTSGEPVAGAKVIYRLYEDRNVGPEPFVTDKKGRYGFLGLRGGNWVVRVEAEGHYPWEGLAEVYSSGVSPEVEAVLEPIPQEELIAKGRYEANQYLEAGDQKMQQGDPAGARAEYEQALGLVQEVDKPIMLGAIGATYLAEGDIAGAKGAYEQALAIDPDHIESLKGMCNIVAYEGDLERADALLAQIPADEPVHPNVLITMAMAHFNQGEAEKSKELLDRAIRDYPEDALSHYYRGLTELSLGDNEAALADLERSLELDPSHREAANARDFISQLGGAGS